MLKSLKIENFRSFQSFELKQFGRINLLVGENNSGKTSILEAIQLFYSRFNLELLSQMMINRGEISINDDRRVVSVGRERELDICHLFYNHEIVVGSKFFILGDSENSQERLDFLVASHESTQTEQLNLSEIVDDLEEFKGLDLIIGWDSILHYDDIRLPLSPDGGLRLDYVRRFRRNIKNLTTRTQFVTPLSLGIKEMIPLFEQIVLKPEEELITLALQQIDPRIRRIAPNTSGYSASNRGGFFILLTDNQRIPIGSMGDGIWRMLGLTLSAVCTKDGILLIDEIDTGLHFTTMTNMWRMLWETAKLSNVQIFATTHSRDCWESLAELVESENISEGEITIHRIERDKPTSVMFNEREMVIAAERGIEVR